jgi:NADPH-dependent 2,4-dienoyl-CoA reductase/sulfur reductase-like enzyme
VLGPDIARVFADLHRDHGMGAQPNVALAERAGLAVGNGIVVDQTLRSSDPRIYAAGDVANAYHPLYGTHVRVEHWATALHSGPAAARSMLGSVVGNDRLPYFYTDQYDLGMEYTGHAPAGGYDMVAVRGDLAKRGVQPGPRRVNHGDRLPGALECGRGRDHHLPLDLRRRLPWRLAALGHHP